jgi:hypothetical protein
MAFGDAGVVEIVRRVARHAKLLLFKTQPPSDLYARREVAFKRRVRYPNEAGQIARLAQLGGEESEAVPREVFLALRDKGAALLACGNCGEEFMVEAEAARLQSSE